MYNCYPENVYYQPPPPTMNSNNEEHYYSSSVDYQYSQQYYNNSTQYSYPYNSYPYSYYQQHPFVVNKPSTPLLTNLDVTSAKSDSSTPEKPILNDSGIDIISPQLANNTVIYNQQQFQQQPIKETNESDDEDDQVEEDDEAEEEEVEENKENKAKKSKSLTGGNNYDENDASKPPKPYLEIIADAILSSHVRMMQLHEIYHFMEKKYQYFAKNINKSWRNSVRHNLSLNECFVKAGRGSNGKGNFWRIHNLCEKEFVRGNFRRKSFKQLIRAGQQQQQQQQHQQLQNQHHQFLSPHYLPHLTTTTTPHQPFTYDYALNNYKSIISPQQQQLVQNNGQYSSSSSSSSTEYNSNRSESSKTHRHHPYQRV